jgi:short-subunit dehydrogenase
MNLTDQVVLMTGASQGIGAEAVSQLAQRGARVVLGARTRPVLDERVAAIRAAGGIATAVTLDVTSDESVRVAVEQVLAEHGRIDVLINNAGNGGQLGRFLERPAADSRSLYEVHVFGCERMTRAVLPSMLARGRGRVVNVVSTVAYVPMPGAAAYCAAKAAVIAFTQALRGELAEQPVELSLFSPPHTQTEAGKSWPLNLPKQFSPYEAAAALVFALEHDKLNHLAGGNQSLLWLQRLSPGLASGIMRRLGLEALRKVKTLAA